MSKRYKFLKCRRFSSTIGFINSFEILDTSYPVRHKKNGYVRPLIKTSANFFYIREKTRTFVVKSPEFSEAPINIRANDEYVEYPAIAMELFKFYE
jgi:hypothetical protein